MNSESCLHGPAPKPSLARRPGRIALRLVRIALLVYLGLILVLSFLQEWLIFPGHSTQGQKQALIIPSPDSQLIALKTSHADQIYVLLGKSLTPDGLAIRPDSSSCPTIIFFYGNAMCLADALGFCRDWRKAGANVLGVEYPGYGMSGGKPGEAAFYSAADAAYNYLLSRTDIDHTKIIPVGLSLGTGVAVDLASRKPVAALALFAPYTSMDDLAAQALPWFPTRAILRHHFPSLGKIASLRMPILIAHGRHDTIIPHEMSVRLAAAATHADVKFLLLETDHNDLFERAGDQLHDAMLDLIDRVARQPALP